MYIVVLQPKNKYDVKLPTYYNIINDMQNKYIFLFS